MNITFTGIDHTTTQAMVEDLLADHRVELGVLYSATAEGRNRYPTVETIRMLLGWCRGRGALHVCGRPARRQLFESDPAIIAMTSLVRRVQVNGILTPGDVGELVTMNPSYTIITQHTYNNTPLLSVKASNHALLVDSSGGRGLAPKRWERPATDKPVGFAGGLGPETIVEALGQIRKVARDPYWIDMEGHIRDEADRFSLSKALKVLQLIDEGGTHG